jgi:hypothetical protein
MSCSDENLPAVANVYRDKANELKGKKANELIESSQTETVKSVPKPVATTGKDDCRDRKRKREKCEGEPNRESEMEGELHVCQQWLI